MLRLLTIGLMVLMFNAASASLVPFKGDLPSSVKDRFQMLQASSGTDPVKAGRMALSILSLTSDGSARLRAWALLNYCYILLDNDSIVKARRLLNDSSQANWANTESWLTTYRGLELGMIASFNADYAAAGGLFRTAIKETGSRDDVLKAKLLQAYADNLRFEGKLGPSLNKWYEALELSEKIGDSTEIIASISGRAAIRFLQNELDMAEADLTIAFDYNTRTGNRKEQANNYSLFGLLNYQRGDYELSNANSLKSFEIRKTINDIKGQGESLNNLALGHMGLKNWDQALRYLNQAMELKTVSNDLTQMTVIMNNMGNCYRRLGQYDEALRYFEGALQKGMDNGQMGDVQRAYRNIISLDAHQKNFEGAYSMQRELLSLKDSLARAEQKEAINELEVKHETLEKEHTIKLLEQEKTIITNRWLTLALSLFLAIVIAVLTIDNQKRNHKNEKKLLLAEDELRQSELKTLAEKLEHNRNKLSIYTENLLRKNELVGQLEEKLIQLDKGTEDSKELLKDFSNVRILTDNDWEEFKVLFEGVHAGLLRKLLNTYPNLTLGEQRLFLLMKLGLSTKEKANILGVSPGSVKKARYRLKKRIGLNDSFSLQEFVRSFE